MMSCGFNQIVFAPPRSGMSVFSCFTALSEAEVGAVLGNAKAMIFVKPVAINPVAGFGHFPEGILGFLQDTTGERLTSQQRRLARDIGLDVVREGDGTLHDLIEAWAAEPELAAFSRAVARVMLPGRK